MVMYRFETCTQRASYITQQIVRISFQKKKEKRKKKVINNKCFMKHKNNSSLNGNERNLLKYYIV